MIMEDNNDYLIHNDKFGKKKGLSPLAKKGLILFGSALIATNVLTAFITNDIVEDNARESNNRLTTSYNQDKAKLWEENKSAIKSKRVLEATQDSMAIFKHNLKNCEKNLEQAVLLLPDAGVRSPD